MNTYNRAVASSAVTGATAPNLKAFLSERDALLAEATNRASRDRLSWQNDSHSATVRLESSSDPPCASSAVWESFNIAYSTNFAYPSEHAAAGWRGGQKPNATLRGTFRKVMQFPNKPERVEIAIDGQDHLHEHVLRRA
jgi:hypothetical protein